jgi:voltage-gated sodium channel
MSNVFPETAGRIVHSPGFQRFVIATILLAGVLAGIETDAAMMVAHGPLLRTLDAVVLGIFIIEAILKFIAHSPRPLNYFRDGWNVFDFSIIVLCLLPMDSQFAAVLRLGRTLRLLRLVSTCTPSSVCISSVIIPRNTSAAFLKHS